LTKGSGVTTPIIMLILMAGPYLGVRLFSAITHRDFDGPAAAAVGLAVLFIFTGAGHFIETESMTEMLPSWVPARAALVYATGFVEFAIALGLLIRKTRRFAGWAAAALLVFFFPVNVYAAMNHVSMGGHAWGPVYLLVRGPLQLIILLWVYWFTIRPFDPAK
jgi:uncharacterized membrane protein